MGTAAVQGDLWGRHPEDWAYEQETQMTPLYEKTLAALTPLDGLDCLDAGCGSGLMAAMGNELGARVGGLDACEPLLKIARTRSPGADFRVGDLEELPYADGRFDVVTAFNSLQYAGDRVRALGELVRVTRPGGRVAVGMWGDPARCETDALFGALAGLMPVAPGPMPLNLAAPGVLEEMFDSHRLHVVGDGEVELELTYSDLDTAWRVHSSAGPFARAIDHSGVNKVRRAFDGLLGPTCDTNGATRQGNIMRYLIGRTPA